MFGSKTKTQEFQFKLERPRLSLAEREQQVRIGSSVSKKLDTKVQFLTSR